MKKTVPMIILALFSTTLFASDAANGKKLYDEANCKKCHSDKMFTQEARKVQDFKKLQWRVMRCDFTMGTGWFDDEQEDVVDYLNSSFYKFEPAKK